MSGSFSFGARGADRSWELPRPLNSMQDRRAVRAQARRGSVLAAAGAGGWGSSRLSWPGGDQSFRATVTSPVLAVPGGPQVVGVPGVEGRQACSPPRPPPASVLEPALGGAGRRRSPAGSPSAPPGCRRCPGRRAHRSRRRGGRRGPSRHRPAPARSSRLAAAGSRSGGVRRSISSASSSARRRAADLRHRALRAPRVGLLAAGRDRSPTGGRPRSGARRGPVFTRCSAAAGARAGAVLVEAPRARTRSRGRVSQHPASTRSVCSERRRRGPAAWRPSPPAGRLQPVPDPDRAAIISTQPRPRPSSKPAGEPALLPRSPSPDGFAIAHSSAP